MHSPNAPGEIGAGRGEDLAVLLQPGLTCWRTERVVRAAFLLDNATYFSAAKAVMLKARRTIHLIGWAFDPLTQLEPDHEGKGPVEDQIAEFLKRLAAERPELDVRVLVWKSALPIAASQHFFPHRARRAFRGSRVKFRLDATVPFGACHHQKVLVVDDRIAFCGGGDISVDRWDSMRHRERDSRRTMPWGKIHGPRHEVMAMLEGPAAAALGELARRRWELADGERLEPPRLTRPEAAVDYWPERVEIDLGDVQVGIARSEPGWNGGEEVRESERLHLAAIARAERLIYLENQYVTSPIYAEALAARLAEPEGPEVVIVSTARAPSWFDHMTMDRTRSSFLRRLREADAHGRFHAFCPFTKGGRENIIVHSKVSIIDDWMLRAGSTNLNNRSAGFDTECDVAVEAAPLEGAARAAIRRFRSRLVAHYIGCRPEAFAEAHAAYGSLAKAIQALDEHHRLRPLEPVALGPLATVISAYHLGDPVKLADSWRPWRRKADLEAERQTLLKDLRATPPALPAAEAAAPETLAG